MSKFDQAVQSSLKAGQSFVEALNDLHTLVKELDEAVQRATAGAVSVVATPHRAGSDSYFGSTLGRDPEDRARTLVVVAKSKDDARTLWEVKHSPDGYPISVIASDASVTRCATREDLEATFLELLQQGATGRKLKLLQEDSTKRAS